MKPRVYEGAEHRNAVVTVRLMDTAELEGIVGTLSRTSQMPCLSMSLPAKRCPTGSRLHGIKGSACEHCYARDGFYAMANVVDVLEFRWKALSHPLWTYATAELICRRERSGFFRIFDSGDLQSVEHLLAIFAIAGWLHWIRFWLPTQERGFVHAALRLAKKPSNLRIRISTAMVDAQPGRLPPGCGSATQQRDRIFPIGHPCPVPHTVMNCNDVEGGPCRACWDEDVPNVDYPWQP